MAAPQKPRRPWGQYASAEDLCDPCESPDEPSCGLSPKPTRAPIRTSSTKPSSGRSPAGGYRPLYRSPTAYDAASPDAADTAEAGTARRPRRHAVNLVEALEADGGKPTPPRAASSKPTPTQCAASETPAARQRAASGARFSDRPDAHQYAASGGPASRQRAVPAPDEGAFAIRAVHPSGEGDTVAVELCVPTDFAASALGAAGAASGRKNGLYAKNTPKNARWSPGCAPVAPRSPSRSKCGFSAISAENEAAAEPSDTVPDAVTDASAYSAESSDATARGVSSEVETTTTRLKLYLLIEQYADLHPQVGVVTEETAEALVAAGKLCAAVRRGMRLLGYGDRSARRLAYQLAAKGVERETAEAAAAYLVEKGLIQEDNSACLRASAGVRKLWGPRRIRDDLRANGYTSDAVEEAMESLADVDFEANCVTLIRRKYRTELSDGTLLSDRSARQKLTAALMRLGYDSDNVRAALRTVGNSEIH